MAQVIQIKRRVGTTGAPATLAAGEPAANVNAGVADLYIGDGSAVRTLVSASRQVELTGDQTITGEKTIAVGDLKVTGGASGNVITTDGAGNLSWGSTLTGISVDPPIIGSGTAGDPFTVDIASDAEIATGTETEKLITPAGLRSQLGAAASTLTTTAQTIVPAINELRAEIAAVSGALQFVGTYNADDNEVTGADAGTLTVGQPLPAAAAGNEGWFVIVDTAGVGTAPAPTVQMSVGDWIVSTGTAWVHVPLYHAAVAAANVSVTAINSAGWSNVQQALQGLYTLAGSALETVAVDGVSILGDGTTGDPLEVGTVDGGTY